MLHRIISFLPLTALIATAQEPEATVIELRETISKIVDTQTLESKERLDWEARKQEMTALLELHQRELALLNEELEKAGQSAPGHGETTEEMKAQIDDLKSARRLASEAVARTTPRALSMSKRFPSPLLKDCEAELSNLNAWKPTDEPREALQSVLSLIAKAQQFNRRLTRSSEVREDREVEVLYLGLAAAFYADRKKNAGSGHPGPDGWVWKSNPDIRPELISAFDSLDKKRPPAMVRLPLEIK